MDTALVMNCTNVVSNTGGVFASGSGEVLKEEKDVQRNSLLALSTLFTKPDDPENNLVKGGVGDGLPHITKLLSVLLTAKME